MFRNIKNWSNLAAIKISGENPSVEVTGLSFTYRKLDGMAEMDRCVGEYLTGKMRWKSEAYKQLSESWRGSW